MKKVFVGLSGGVDSSVSALLLKEAGYDVTGVFIKVWQPDFIECTWKEDRLDAMRIASQLNIPFVTLDLEKEYKEGVVDYMIREYKEGRTPNPDVMCNREVKFGAFLRYALEQGADFVATGHYARTQGGKLLKGVDGEKDQSYFLWTLKEEQLKHILFPVGHLEKKEVREIAKKHDLYTHAKKDSQGLCFVGTIDMKTLLKEYIDEKEGDVVDEKGIVLGKHDGVTFYTIGERHGFTIFKKTSNDEPYYVIGKDIEKNILIVSPTQESKTTNDIALTDVSFGSGIPHHAVTYEARARYRAPLAKVTLMKDRDDDWRVAVKDGNLTPTPGQSLVVYDGEVCLGGGIIVY